MLSPSGHWTWYWDDSADKLAIQLDGELCMLTAYGEKQLNNKISKPEAFCLSDTEVYYECLECLQINCQYLSEAEKVQICLNACAAKKFHKAVPLKSWFYDVQNASVHSELVATVSAHSQGTVLITEYDTHSATCMLLDKNFSLTENKVLSQFSLIKVSTDRLQRLTVDNFQQKYA